MWGRRRFTTRSSQRQPSHQHAAGIPPDHPTLVYVNEAILLDARTGFLATAVYGPDRADYWHAALTAATHEPAPAAPTPPRIAEFEQQISQLHTRLRRQVLALEDDDLDPAARRRITTRIAELDADLTEHQTTLAASTTSGRTPHRHPKTSPTSWPPSPCSATSCASCRSQNSGRCWTAWT
jgi:hypothetical protein